MGLGARWHEIARTYADVNMAFGDIVKVTPSSKVVGDMAIFLVNHNMTMEQFERLAARPQPDAAALRSSRCSRVAGRAGGRLAAEAAEDHSARRQAAARHGPARICRRWIWKRPPLAVEKKIGRKPQHDEVLSYLMYPEVFVKFARSPPDLRRCGRAADAAVLTTAWSAASEMTVELEPGKALVIKFLTVGEPHPDGTRTVFFELNGQPREVTVRDRKLEVKAAPQAARPIPTSPARSARPSPGVVSTVAVELNQTREEGRPPAGAGSHEDAEHGLRAGRRAGDARCWFSQASTWRPRTCC